jgi:hypothetical protein
VMSHDIGIPRAHGFVITPVLGLEIMCVVEGEVDLAAAKRASNWLNLAEKSWLLVARRVRRALRAFP